ncbi:MAG: hypothetical protein ACLTZT_08410 [Butyricimonas faecalis]
MLQSLVVVFLVCDIQRRRNKAESREVLFVRPLTNARMFWAELVGMALLFGGRRGFHGILPVY